MPIDSWEIIDSKIGEKMENTQNTDYTMFELDTGFKISYGHVKYLDVDPNNKMLHLKVFLKAEGSFTLKTQEGIDAFVAGYKYYEHKRLTLVTMTPTVVDVDAVVKEIGVRVDNLISHIDTHVANNITTIDATFDAKLDKISSKLERLNQILKG